MAFIDAGYDGTVDEVQFAKLLNRYAVVGPDDFKASAVAGADRTLSIANGTALGPGSLNVGSAFAPIQFDAVASGTSRWDLVVLRRNWQPASGTTTLEIIKGGATAVLPTRNTNPGVLDDQPLYLQQVNAGSTSLGQRIDLRVWVGSGGAEAADKLALTYLAQPGAAVKIGWGLHRYELQGNGVWGWQEYSLQAQPLLAKVVPVNGTSNGNAEVDTFFPAFPNAVLSVLFTDQTFGGGASKDYRKVELVNGRVRWRLYRGDTGARDTNAGFTVDITVLGY
ncbi:hypothetical protein [Arthrobacter sp. MDT1-65]